ncbi:MAG: transcription-repair coupling factor [Bacteroidales bacterium]|nr:transcription-repair coupling factor [Bacteroidales bacterium]
MELPEKITQAPRIDCFTTSAKAVYAASVLSGTKQPVCSVILAENKKSAYFVTSDLYNFFPGESVFFFPETTDRNELKTASSKVQRTAAISALNDFSSRQYPAKIEELLQGGHFDLGRIKKDNTFPVIIVTYPEALEEKVLKQRKTRESILRISKGDRLSHEFVSEILFNQGFVKADFVSEPGEFALRGSLIDIFSFSDNYPYRIDFFGDEVDSIRRFDANTQLSVANLDSVEIYPDLTENFSESDYVSFWEIVPRGTLFWDFRETGEHNSSNVVPQPTFNKNFEILAKDIESRINQGYEVTILSPNDAQTRRLEQILRDIGSGVRPAFLPVSLHEGYVDKESKKCFYTDHQIFERYHKIRIRRQVERSERLTINELSSFHTGDYVVHIDHGVGRFGGLVKTKAGDKVQEAIKLEYRDGDVIFVPVSGIHRISKYKSRDGEPPRIYKLGSKAWENLKNTTKAKVKDIAQDLIKLYSERQQSRGFAFSGDTYLQQELESSFLYEDTPDQQKATAAIKEDMESIHPMDRLICGDVGFGKTELAIRAAFKAACDGKQVAVLVPTTILALQHYRTFSERLKDFPCTVDYLSRLRSASDIKSIQQRLKEGKIDIIIGTHRLINKKIEFKDLGLLIIDEEQKFGVTAKERLRQLKATVDTLTLTATPIPRTLQFSLLGARDLSIINTPPPNRLPVYTEVIPFEDDAISEIITREMERGGQIFFVHNKIEDINSVYDILHRIVPEAEICIAHGRMEPEVLEKKIIDFIDGEYDILLSTSIMENGIDIPNANTIIINQAQKFGLSDLHQLRGRVGRSNVKAYCYLIVPPIASLTDDARRRIRAIEAFSDLGSGFNIAMQDLDIRGAGNLLGAEQSGFIAEMGFETYMRILNEAMAELPLQIREEEASNRDHQMKQAQIPVLPGGYAGTVDTSVDTDLELLIPDTYVNVQTEKIRLYKELDTMTQESELERFRREAEDRFGPVPPELEGLMDVVRLRREAQRAGIEKVVLKQNIMLLYFVSNRMSPFYKSREFGKVLENIQKYGSRFSVKPSPDKLYVKSENVTTVRRAVELMKLLTEGLNGTKFE